MMKIDISGHRMTSVLQPHDNSRYFGVLTAIEPAEDCQIATIDQIRVVLPTELDLSGYMGQRIGIACICGKFYVRRAEEVQ